ncbi:hypothetical protein CF327_g4643 [Tilletia walkeri]|uniref:Major facilitator superfamily (MFS) profile domain-containing protein n=1 Tax=Tilletia walkeri TaxID=117179 RepID=A0A8X7N818_9BASI|nr:hypothetical protein CF327_g4643 [Tilletia walkeri]KAE8268429.1 hypothetical protein A4X09_0g3919 [Tilletia walkeri]
MPSVFPPPGLRITPINKDDEAQGPTDGSDSPSQSNPDIGSASSLALGRTLSPGILQTAPTPTKSTSESSLFVPISTTVPSPSAVSSSAASATDLPSPDRKRSVDFSALKAADQDDSSVPGNNQSSSVSWAPIPNIARSSDGLSEPAGSSRERTMHSSHSSPALPTRSHDSPLSSSSSTPKASSTASLSPSSGDSNNGAVDDDEVDGEAGWARRGRRPSVTKAVADLRKQLGLTNEKPGPPPITPGRTPLVEELEEGTDPLDWSMRFKTWATTCYCIMIMSTTFASSSYAAATPTIQEVFGVSRTVALLGTSLYVLGFAVGPLIWAPTSEVVGRKPVYVGSFIALTAFGLGVAFAQNMQTIVICRFFSGVCGSSALNNVAASISDMTRVRNRLRFNTAYRLVSFGGPTLGPIVGTFVLRVGFRWNLRLNPIFSFVALVLYTFTIPESHRPTLLRRQQRARERAIQSSDQLGKEESEVAMNQRKFLRQPRGSTLQRYKIAATQPWKLLTEPLVIIVCAYTALLYGLLYGVLAAFPLIWQEIRGRNEEYASLVYLALLGGFAAGALFIGCWFQDRSFKKVYDRGEYVPESRIGPAVWASFLVPIGLLIFGWTSPYDELVGAVDVHFVVPCLALVLFTAGMGIVFNSWLSYLSDAYSTQAASAMAAATFSRSLLGAAFPLFMREMLMGMTIQGTFTFFAGLSVLLSIGGIWFVKKGQVIRERSKYASHTTQ